MFIVLLQSYPIITHNASFALHCIFYYSIYLSIYYTLDPSIHPSINLLLDPFRSVLSRHGRVAMAAFVGYCVQSNFVFPWSLTFGGLPHPSADLSPPEQWDALPVAAKVQIVAFVGFLEWYSELSDNDNGPHYTKGGKPGQYPSFQNIPHGKATTLDLFDPFKLSAKRTDEQKERGLLIEINNGRLAMLGIFGFLCEQTIPGSVPALGGIVKPYAGEVMAPFV